MIHGRLLRWPMNVNMIFQLYGNEMGKKAYFEINTNFETLDTYLTSGAHKIYFLLSHMHHRLHNVNYRDN